SIDNNGGANKSIRQHTVHPQFCALDSASGSTLLFDSDVDRRPHLHRNHQLLFRLAGHPDRLSTIHSDGDGIRVPRWSDGQPGARIVAQAAHRDRLRCGAGGAFSVRRIADMDHVPRLVQRYVHDPLFDRLHHHLDSAVHMDRFSRLPPAQSPTLNHSNSFQSQSQVRQELFLLNTPSPSSSISRSHSLILSFP
ncbi:hypothetical protein PENTCL1PPCAC_250, partial [Pristionchus entomophagus]